MTHHEESPDQTPKSQSKVIKTKGQDPEADTFIFSVAYNNKTKEAVISGTMSLRQAIEVLIDIERRLEVQLAIDKALEERSGNNKKEKAGKR